MDVPISEIDIEYLIDAAEKTSEEKDIPKYFPYILFKKAQETLKKLIRKQTSICPTDYVEDLESRTHEGIRRITLNEDLYIPTRPDDYRENESIIEVLVKIYGKYIEKNKIDEIREEDEKHKKWGILGPNFQVLEGRSAMRERILTTSKALRTALKMLTRVERGDTSEADFIREKGISAEFLQNTAYDDSNEFYNIIPLDGRILPNEVTEAIALLKLGNEDFPPEILDCLKKFFKFQESSVSNQRENILNLLSNELMRTPGERKPAIDKALKSVFDKSLGNYIEWCRYLSIDPIWKNRDENAAGEGENAISNEHKILYISLYYLIWGEAANVRFLPECLCYIFHKMSEQFDKYFSPNGEQVPKPYEGSFIDEVIKPLYEVIAAEAKINSKRDAPHSKWRNYDDFNEYFWSPDCLKLDFPFDRDSRFFQKPPKGSTTVYGKTSFIEHRTFWHLYHSFHRMWIFHVIMFQALVIFAFNGVKLNSETLRQILIVGPTYFSMKLIQSRLDIWLKDGAYSNTDRAYVSRIRFRIICFRALCLLSTLIIYSIGIFRKCLQEKTSSVEESIVFYACIVVLVLIMWINQLEKCVVRLMGEGLLASYLKEEYVGRGMGEKYIDIFWYTTFWIVTLAINYAFTYYGLIRPLVRPTRDIADVTKNIHNMLAIGSLWAGVICAYIVVPHIIYNVTSAVVGYIVGRRDGLGKIKSLGDVHKCFDSIPNKFMDHVKNRKPRPENDQEDVNNFFHKTYLYISYILKVTWDYIKWKPRPENDQEDVKKKGKLDAEEFSPFWNQIVMNLREEDYISDLEQYALSMPEKSRFIDVIQWPLFLLASKVSLAIKIAEKNISQKDMWDEISRDVYMKYAIEECFHSVKFILKSVLNDQGKEWIDGIYDGINKSIAADGNLGSEFQLDALEFFVKAISGLTEIHISDQHAKLNLNYLNGVILHDFLGEKKAAGEQILESDWPTDPELRSQITRLHWLVTIDKSADHVPRNREARRRLEFFTNSLFMSMPFTKPVREMLSFSVLTPFCEETVLYGLPELQRINNDGVTLLDYLKNLYPDEWTNYCERKDKRYIIADDRDSYELRLWASYRGQTLARTVRGTMYYQKALLLQAYREMLIAEGSGSQSLNSKCLDKAKAHVDLKFTYVVTCQKYGEQKINDVIVADDIAFLLKKNEGLRVAFVDKNEKNEFYSKLVKADKNGKEKEVYSIKLPGNPILGEGKPENQNHAIVFTRGNAIQTIDMNQDNYFEETLKMRNLLEEFHREPAPTILGIREHIFTGSASSLASFMSNQETGFVTLGQRVIAKPLKVRMHYGHPDVFDRVFHITRGGISKASPGINLSEDIYAGFNSTLRKGSVTHHEYIQVGKGRDVGFNQIAIFEGKVAGGNGEQVLSRDMYRLGQQFDFFRMHSLYYSTVGYYFSSLLTVITLYILLYGNLIMALSGTKVPHKLNDTDMIPELLLMIVLLPASYIVCVLILEQGFEKAVESFLTMFSRLCSIFFAFSLGTRIHRFGRSIMHGGASYQATDRGFVLDHIKFSENYRLFSRSHFVKGIEVLFLVLVYIIYGFHSFRAIYNNLLLLGGSILSISWIVAPFLFNSSAFNLKKNLEDWQDWNNWLNLKSNEVDQRKTTKEQVKESWEVWWDTELAHIRTFEGRVIETILCLRFFIFMYVVISKICVQGSIKSLLICGLFWILFVVILLAYKVLSKKNLRVLAIIVVLATAFFTSAYVHDSMFYNECYTVNVGDILAFIIAFITTLWGILSICVAWKPKLVMGFAKICDAGMGTLMFSIASMLSRRSIKQYLLRNMFDHNVSEYLQKSSAETASLYGRGF